MVVLPTLAKSFSSKGMRSCTAWSRLYWGTHMCHLMSLSRRWGDWFYAWGLRAENPMKIESESTRIYPRLSELGVMALDHNRKAGLSSALRTLMFIVACL